MKWELDRVEMPSGPLWVVCTDEGVIADAWDEAKARLIAAAPDLHAALVWLLHLHHNVGKGGQRPEPGEWEEAIKAGLAAAAKAERDEALELACLATHVGDEDAARRWREVLARALEEEREETERDPCP